MVHLPSLPLSVYTEARFEPVRALGTLGHNFPDHPPPTPSTLGPQLHFGSGLGVWSLLAGGTPALCERCLLCMGPSMCLVPDAVPMPISFCLCSAWLSLSPVLFCLGLSLGSTPCSSLCLLCSGALELHLGAEGSPCLGITLGSCFALPVGTASPGCCWTLLQCPVIKRLPQHWQPILPLLSFPISGRNGKHSSLPRLQFPGTSTPSQLLTPASEPPAFLESPSSRLTLPHHRHKAVSFL